MSSSSTLLWQLARAVGLLATLPFGALVLFAVYLLTRCLARFAAVNLLCLERYKDIPAPRHESRWYTLPIFGDLHKIRDAPTGEAHLQWMRETRSDVLVYRHLFYAPRLLLVDPKAMMHVLSAQHSYSFPKPQQLRDLLASMLGNGVLVVEGDVHKRQRKILQPAFGVSAIRNLTPTFFKHSENLVSRLGQIIDETTGPAPKAFLPGQSDASAQASEAHRPVLNVSHWLSRATLDIIGEAGFNWSFNSIKQDGEELDEVSEAFKATLLFGPPSPLFFLKSLLQTKPSLQWLKHLELPRERSFREAYAVLERTSQVIIAQKRRQILQEMHGVHEKGSKLEINKADWEAQGHDAAGGKDLLMLMMRSNMSSDIRESERLSDAELLGQMTTLLLAGHETTATLISWALHELSLRPDVQAKLRAEAREYMAGRDELSFDELSSLPYLDAVVKETLRFSSPIPSTRRVCEKDTVLPLSKAYPRRDGKGTFDSVVMKKGDEVLIPIFLINTSEAIWGPDALTFKPERWTDVPQSAKESGMPLQMLSFLSGPRGCIGNRFALAEGKALLLRLVLAFQFEPVDGWELERTQSVVMRARVKGQEHLGAQMPLRISRV